MTDAVYAKVNKFEAMRQPDAPAVLAASSGSARSGLEILESLKREGWREDIMGIVMVSGDKTLVQVVWPDGRRIEAPNDQALPHGGAERTPNAE